MRSFILLLLFSLAGLSQGRDHNERWYQERIVKRHLKGEMEKRVENGRVDILTATHAIEVDFADKWKNAIGQALWYAIQTNRKPGVVLILEKKDDFKHLVRLNSTLKAAGLDRVKVWAYPDDFEKIEDKRP